MAKGVYIGVVRQEPLISLNQVRAIPTVSLKSKYVAVVINAFAVLFVVLYIELGLKTSLAISFVILRKPLCSVSI